MEIHSYPSQSETVCYNEGEDRDSLLYDAIALANNRGGTIYCGINRKGKVRGIEPDAVVKSFEFRLKECANSEISWTWDKVIINSKLIVIIQIDESTKLISLDCNAGDKKVYYRLQEHTVLASKIIVRLIHLKKGKLQIEVSVDSEDVNRIIDEVHSTAGITLSQLYKKVDLPKSKIDSILPDLLFIGEIGLRWNNDSIEFIS